MSYFSNGARHRVLPISTMFMIFWPHSTIIYRRDVLRATLRFYNGVANVLSSRPVPLRATYELMSLPTVTLCIRSSLRYLLCNVVTITYSNSASDYAISLPYRKELDSGLGTTQWVSTIFQRCNRLVAAFVCAEWRSRLLTALRARGGRLIANFRNEIRSSVFLVLTR